MKVVLSWMTHLVCLLATCWGLSAQQTVLSLKTTNFTGNSEPKHFPFTKQFSDKKKALEAIDSISKILDTEGYFDHSFTLYEKDSLLNAVYTLGTKTDRIQIHYTDEGLNREVIEKLTDKITDRYFEIETEALEKTLASITAHYEGKGYPFASVSLKNIKREGNSLRATLKVNSAAKRTIDQLVIKGYKAFTAKKLLRMLGLDRGANFTVATLGTIREQLDQLGMVSQAAPPEVLFTKEATTVYVYLEKAPNNRFDGLIGFGNEEGGSLALQGDLSLALSNAFHQGEAIYLNWYANPAQRALKLHYIQPYIFNSPFIVKGQFELFKKDQSHTSQVSRLDLGYHTSRRSSLRAVWSYERSYISADHTGNQGADFDKQFGGISYLREGYRASVWAKKPAYNMEASLLTGWRNTGNRRNSQGKYLLNLQYRHPLGQRSQLVLKSHNEWLHSSSELVENELFRIGGLHSIRGFDQESVLSEKYSVNSLEYHYKTQQSASLYALSDFALTKDPFAPSTNRLLALGIGYRFQTPVGNFDLTYAMGKTENSHFKPGQARLHIKATYLY